jgi:hypothetical protein
VVGVGLGASRQRKGVVPGRSCRVSLGCVGFKDAELPAEVTAAALMLLRNRRLHQAVARAGISHCIVSKQDRAREIGALLYTHAETLDWKAPSKGYSNTQTPKHLAQKQTLLSMYDMTSVSVRVLMRDHKLRIRIVVRIVGFEQIGFWGSRLRR